MQSNVDAVINLTPYMKGYFPGARSIFQSSLSKPGRLFFTALISILTVAANAGPVERLQVFQSMKPGQWRVSFPGQNFPSSTFCGLPLYDAREEITTLCGEDGYSIISDTETFGEIKADCGTPNVQTITERVVANKTSPTTWSVKYDGSYNGIPLQSEVNYKYLGPCRPNKDQCAPEGVIEGGITDFPIAPYSGEKFLDESDYFDTSPHPLSITRHYQSYANFGKSPISPKWSSPLIGWAEFADDGKFATINIGTSSVSFEKSGANWLPVDGGMTTLQLINQAGVTAYVYRPFPNDISYTFNLNGLLQTVTERNGWKSVYAYDSIGRAESITNNFGRKLAFRYNNVGRIDQVTLPDNKKIYYEYTPSGLLGGVIQADGTKKIYSYENIAFPELLTSVTDENGVILSTFTYDSTGRAVESTKSQGVDRYAISYPSDNSYEEATITDPLGTSRRFEYSLKNGLLAVTSSEKSSGTGRSAAQSREQNASGLVESRIDFKGNQTSYKWDEQRQLPIATTYALGSSEEYIATTEWHPLWKLPLTINTPVSKTSFTYDEKGNTLTKQVQGVTSGSAPILWQWAYSSGGLVEKETAPNGGISKFNYDSIGNLIEVINPLEHADRFTYEDGRVKSHTSPTGLITRYDYDKRGRPTAIDRNGHTVQYTYRPSGQLETITSHTGYSIAYRYDEAQRLVGWEDNRRNKAEFILDRMGNRVVENIKDNKNHTAWELARTINDLNRVESVTIGGSQGVKIMTSHGYDSNGFLIKTAQNVDGGERTTMFELDALNRVKNIKNAQGATAALEYNALDAITKVVDFKDVATSYQRDHLGNATGEKSNDVGSSSFIYDPLGLPISIVDALGRGTNITRDKLGRPTKIESTQAGASRTSFLRYDLRGTDFNAQEAPNASKGLLSEIQDLDVTTRFQRDLLGRITAKSQTLASGDVRRVAYSYVPAGDAGAGQLAYITYPSGKQLGYQYDSTGQLKSLTWAGQPLISSLTWNPLGLPTGWVWNGFGLAEQRAYTSAGQLATTSMLDLTWDSAGRIRQIQQQHMLPGTASVPQQATITSAYTYDAVGRLTASAHNGGPNLVLPAGWTLSDTIGPNAAGYSYDANGNRSQVHYSTTTLAGTSTLQRTYQTSANRLTGYSQKLQLAGQSAQNTAVAYAHDGTGALIQKGDNHLHYGIDRRIAKAGLHADASSPLAVSYTYNLLGQRLLKSDARLSGTVGTPKTQQTVYADDGVGSTVLGQYGNQRSSTSGSPAGENDSTEIIYLPTASGPMPIAAQINGRLYAIHSDHLNTPRRLTNSQGQVVWQWLITGFGEVSPTTGAGGYVQDATNSTSYSEAVSFNLRYPGQQWDEETGLAYNLHRYYDAATGRYVQSDPIGLNGGWNRFAYVGGNPISRIDPLGLEFVVAGRGVANLYSDDGGLLTSYPYTSGVGGSTDPSARNQGPLPPGHYTFDPLEISEGSFFRDLLGDWGKYRVPLKPTAGTNTFGRDGFFIHGGKKPGSKGCIDLGSGDEDFFSRVRNLQGPVDVFMGPR